MRSGPTVAVSIVALVASLAGCLGGGDGDAPAHGPGQGGASTSPGGGPGAGSSTGPSTGPTAPAASPAPFAMTGTGCQELLLIITVTDAEAREFVPASYTLMGGAGQTAAFVGLKECADLQVDGVSIGPASTSDVGVFVDKGEPGVFHYYQAWWTTDNPLLWARLQAQGWYGGLSNDTLVPLGGAVGVGEGSATVDYDLAKYVMVAQLAATTAAAENHAVGWFDSPNGTVKVDKVLHGSRLGSGSGTVTGDGDLDRLFGPLSRGNALWNEYTMDATVGPA